MPDRSFPPSIIELIDELLGRDRYSLLLRQPISALVIKIRNKLRFPLKHRSRSPNHVLPWLDAESVQENRRRRLYRFCNQPAAEISKPFLKGGPFVILFRNIQAYQLCLFARFIFLLDLFIARLSELRSSECIRVQNVGVLIK